MPINKGGITSVGTHGWWKSEGGACDYPSESDVEAGVEYADGSLTGTFIGSSHFTSVSVSVPSVEVEVD